MSEWQLHAHPDFLKDMKHLSKETLELFHKKLQKIKTNPLRQKHLCGTGHLYREPITKNIRLVYAVEKKFIWLLTIGVHDKSYATFKKRLHSLRSRYDLK